MLPILVYNAKGGQKKSTTTRDLAAANEELGLDTLVVDFDAQSQSVSHYFGVDDAKNDKNADNLALHLIDREKGPFRDIIKSIDGTDHIDVIPSHKMFGRLSQLLDDHEQYLRAGKPDDWTYKRYEQFHKTLVDNNVHEDYDVLLVDTNAKADEAYYLALFATRHLIIPARPTRAGYGAIEDVKDSASNFGEEKGISVTNLATVPTEADLNKNVHEEYVERIVDEYDTPVYFKDLGVFEKAERNNRTVFDELNEKRIRPAEEDIMPKFRTLAGYIYSQTDIEVPQTPWTPADVFLGDDYVGKHNPDELAGVTTTRVEV